ncbi:ADP-glyceromanno-heptose 6-epimerase [Ferruginibacter lapsinanis]|uniref:ADP-glyceromanno-heptose 6-epimerase n=1 Tax=Ferruginibacter lapsinanis TaxID=563172 RepID=UPI001E55D8D5|nr:ADP-glyceromanno-heptose 6-epimerase [Ferruginibacter lapsinanis]UEG48812.1 ADP-glyceromanno-heptose 6-epimerase [Ferruginibacter lapsinanis]
MNKEDIIVVTGAAGFIGSCMVSYLNHQGYENLILVDEFEEEEKMLNLRGKKFTCRVEREVFFEWYDKEKINAHFIFHLGARTDTTEFDYAIHQHLNVEYSQKIWNLCCSKNIPLVYASSAATYGDGALGYNDDHTVVDQLQPLNPYGVSKNEFDKWALRQAQDGKNCPPFWAGLKFFNVYGPNEYHKARMASVIFHSFNQIKQNGQVKLFRSHKEGFKDGEQLRDFIYVKDVIAVCYWLMQHQPASALYNLGTGKARSFKDLVAATFSGLDLETKIEYIDMPEDIRDKYQYFTEANMNKLQAAGYTNKFYSLEEGVEDYVRNYLSKQAFY